MNENDYTLLEYMSMFAGVVMTLNWVGFSLAYDIPITGMNAIFLVIIGIVSFLLAIVFYFKKKIYVLEMKALSWSQVNNKGEDANGKMDRDTAPKL